MSEPPTNFDPRELWQRQAEMNAAVTLTEIHVRASKFRRQAKLRSLQVLVIVPFLILVVWRGHHINSWMMQAGLILTLIGFSFSLWRWLRINSIAGLSNEGEALVKAYRDSLIRLRDGRRSILIWGVAPLMPGTLLVFLGSWIQLHPTSAAIRFQLLVLGFCAVAIVVGYLLNRLVAAKLQKKIDEL